MGEMAFEGITIPDRPEKPREQGITMLIDWGMGTAAQADCLEVGGAYVDLAKIAVGISRMLSEDLLGRKIRLYQDNRVLPFPGGQFLEYAFYHGQGETYFEAACSAGYRWIEVSDNIIDITPQQKMDLIRTAREQFGLGVIGEVGSKVAGTEAAALIEDIRRCLDAGCWKVFVEAAELFGEELNEKLIDEITSAIPLEKLIFETPGPWISGVHMCDQHAIRATLIRRFGPDINLANVAPGDVLEVETMRRGIGVAALKW